MPNADNEFVHRELHLASLVDLWIFGANHDLPDLQDAAMNAIIDKDQFYFHNEQLARIYQNTKPGSLLRKYFYEQFALGTNLADGKWFAKRKEDYPPAFLIDVIQKLNKQLLISDTNRYGRRYAVNHRNRYLLKQNSEASTS